MKPMHNFVAVESKAAVLTIEGRLFLHRHSIPKGDMIPDV
jgi:hypothetical protein